MAVGLPVSWSDVSVGVVAALLTTLGLAQLGSLPKTQVVAESLSVGQMLAWQALFAPIDDSQWVVPSVAAAWLVSDIVMRVLLLDDEEEWRRRVERYAAGWVGPFLVVATGGLMALGWRENAALTALPTVGLYGYVWATYRQLKTADSSFQSMIRSLGMVPEVMGLIPRHHTENCALLVQSISSALGQSPPAKDRLATVAWVHEVGLVRVTDSSLREAGFSSRDVAGWGAEILAGDNELERLSGTISQIGEPYRFPGSPPIVDPVRKDAGIIRVACAYERLVRKGVPHLEAVEQLRRSPDEFLPEAVDALWEFDFATLVSS